MTLAELADAVSDAEHLATALGWDHSNIVITATVNSNHPLELVLIHKTNEVLQRVELTYN